MADADFWKYIKSHFTSDKKEDAQVSADADSEFLKDLKRAIWNKYRLGH